MIRDTLTTIERLGGEMKSFEEWFGEASQNKLFWESPSKASKMGYEAGAQSRQAEIDELQKRIDELEWFAKSIRNWDAHPKDFEIHNGSWGVRDFYRNYADNVLKGEPNDN